MLQLSNNGIRDPLCMDRFSDSLWDDILSAVSYLTVRVVNCLDAHFNIATTIVVSRFSHLIFDLAFVCFVRTGNARRTKSVRARRLCLVRKFFSRKFSRIIGIIHPRGSAT